MMPGQTKEPPASFCKLDNRKNKERQLNAASERAAIQPAPVAAPTSGAAQAGAIPATSGAEHVIRVASTGNQASKVSHGAPPPQAPAKPTALKATEVANEHLITPPAEDAGAQAERLMIALLAVLALIAGLVIVYLLLVLFRETWYHNILPTRTDPGMSPLCGCRKGAYVYQVTLDFYSCVRLHKQNGGKGAYCVVIYEVA